MKFNKQIKSIKSFLTLITLSICSLANASQQQVRLETEAKLARAAQAESQTPMDVNQASQQPVGNANGQQEDNKQLVALQARLDDARAGELEAILKEIESRKLTSQMRFGGAGLLACTESDPSRLKMLKPYLTIEDLVSCRKQLNLMDPKGFLPGCNDAAWKDQCINNHLNCVAIVSNAIKIRGAANAAVARPSAEVERKVESAEKMEEVVVHKAGYDDALTQLRAEVAQVYLQDPKRVDVTDKNEQSLVDRFFGYIKNAQPEKVARFFTVFEKVYGQPFPVDDYETELLQSSSTRTFAPGKIVRIILYSSVEYHTAYSYACKYAQVAQEAGDHQRSQNLLKIQEILLKNGAKRDSIGEQAKSALAYLAKNVDKIPKD